jgi:hypothetical protein
MYVRDIRRDFLQKGTTSFYFLVKELFLRQNIPLDLIFYAIRDDFLKG